MLQLLGKELCGVEFRRKRGRMVRLRGEKIKVRKIAVTPRKPSKP